MNSRSEQLPRFSLCGLFVLTVFASPAVAQVRSWTGSILDGVENPLNWTPYGVPLTNDNIFIGNIVPDAEASIDSVLTFASLTMSNAANLQDYRGGYYVDPFSFDGSQLTVTGATILSNTSALGVRLTTGSLTLNNSSFYDSDFLEVGTTTAIGPAAELGIYGDAMFRGVAGNALNNNGVITAGGMTLIEATNGGMLDLDGTGETGRIVVTQSPQYNNDDG